MRSNKDRTNIYFEPPLRAQIDKFCAAQKLSLTKFVEGACRFVIRELSMAKKCKSKKK
jgi:hypothetical protein